MLIIQTGNTHPKFINIPENNFAKVYFTPQWMDCLSSAVHQPLSTVVGTFISNVQVPVIAHQRAWLGIDNATQNVQGHAYVPRGLVPMNMVAGGQPSSPWRGRPAGVAAASAESAPAPLTPVHPSDVAVASTTTPFTSQHLSGAMATSAAVSLMPQPVYNTQRLRLSLHANQGEIIEISDSDDEADATVPSTPSRPSQKPGAQSSLQAHSATQNQPASPRAPSPSISTISSILISPFLARGVLSESVIAPPTPGLTYYTRFSPIIPPGPASERWLSENGWPARFASVLRKVAEETSLGQWADVLVGRHGVDREPAKAMVKCLLEDSESQYYYLPISI